MSALDFFFYAILPYLALTIFGIGHIWRWRVDQFGWTTRSSQLYEGTLLKYGSPCSTTAPSPPSAATSSAF